MPYSNKTFIAFLCALLLQSFVSAQVTRVDLPNGMFAFTFQEDPQKQVWVGVSDGDTAGSLGYISDGKFIPVTADGGLPSGSFHESIKLPDGSLMFGGNVTASTGKPVLVWVSSMGADTLTIPFSLSVPFINCMSVVNRREIWIGTASGLLINDRGQWSHLTVNDGLPDNSVKSIYQDFRGIVWIGTEFGMVSYSEKQIQPIPKGSRVIPSVTSIFGDNRGYVWCGSRFDSQGVSVYNGQVWETFSGRNGLIDNSTSVFFQAPDGMLWVGSCYSRSRGGVSSFDGARWSGFGAGQHLAKPCVDAIAADGNGRIWFGGSLTPRKGKGITVLDGDEWHVIVNNPKLPAERVIELFKDSYGNIWVSSFEGLFVVDKNFKLE